MKSKAVIAALATLIVFPAALAAQHLIYPEVLGYPGVLGYPVGVGPTVILVGPRAVKVAPGFEPRTATQVIGIVTLGNRGFFPGRYYGDGYGTGYYGTGIVERSDRLAIATRPSRGNSSGTGQILVGSPRADVIERFGRPDAQVVSRQSEKLIFGGTIVVIRDGVVAEFR